MDNLIKFPGVETVEDALKASLWEASELSDVMIIGYRKNADGKFFMNSSSFLTNAEALWLLETAKRFVLREVKFE